MWLLYIKSDLQPSKSEFQTCSCETFEIQNAAPAQSLVDVRHGWKTIAGVILNEKKVKGVIRMEVKAFPDLPRVRSHQQSKIFKL